MQLSDIVITGQLIAGQFMTPDQMSVFNRNGFVIPPKLPDSNHCK